jgi:hypothetical protein
VERPAVAAEHALAGFRFLSTALAGFLSSFLTAATATGFFLYFFFDFTKINSRIKHGQK